jgi:hypothetical protein
MIDRPQIRSAQLSPCGRTARACEILSYGSRRNVNLAEQPMNTGKLTSWMDQAQPILVAFGLKVLGAIAVFVIGRWLIGLVTKLVGAGMTRQHIDPIVQRYLVSFITVALNKFRRAEGFTYLESRQ